MHTSMRMPALAVGQDFLSRHQTRLLASITATLHGCSHQIRCRERASQCQITLHLFQPHQADQILTPAMVYDMDVAHSP